MTGFGIRNQASERPVCWREQATANLDEHDVIAEGADQGTTTGLLKG